MRQKMMKNIHDEYVLEMLMTVRNALTMNAKETPFPIEALIMVLLLQYKLVTGTSLKTRKSIRVSLGKH
jgi:hypothetical protein